MFRACQRLNSQVRRMAADRFFMDPFTFRQFDDPTHSGPRITGITKEAFVKTLNEMAGDSPLVDGYAPFCKHVFVKNFVDAKLTTVEITEANKLLLSSAYQSRTEKELPVLVRWFPKEKMGESPAAKYLDIILYSREQIIKEHQAMGESDAVPDAPWGIVSIKPQDEEHETPMQPITMMRNALGTNEGL